MQSAKTRPQSRVAIWHRAESVTVSARMTLTRALHVSPRSTMLSMYVRRGVQSLALAMGETFNDASPRQPISQVGKALRARSQRLGRTRHAMPLSLQASRSPRAPHASPPRLPHFARSPASLEARRKPAILTGAAPHQRWQVAR